MPTTPNIPLSARAPKRVGIVVVELVVCYFGAVTLAAIAMPMHSPNIETAFFTILAAFSVAIMLSPILLKRVVGAVVILFCLFGLWQNKQQADLRASRYRQRWQMEMKSAAQTARSTTPNPASDAGSAGGMHPPQ